MYDHKYKLEHICSYNVGLQMPPEAIGPVAEGLRLNIYLTGGEVSGPKLRGKVLPVGADWGTMRTDGVFVLDVRATIETHDPALIYKLSLSTCAASSMVSPPNARSSTILAISATTSKLGIN